MHGTIARPSWPSAPIHQRLLQLAALFWLFTYILLSIRAGMIPEAVPTVLSARRIVAVTAGAAIFYAAARHLVLTGAKPSLTTILGTTAVSVAAALTIRVGLDQMPMPEVTSVTYSLRWTLVWTGYFGLWLISTLAFAAALPRTPKPQAAPLAEAAEVVSAPGVERWDAAAWEWLVDVLAAELTSRGFVDSKALAAHLLIRAGYEEADPLGEAGEVQNARARLARAVAARVSATHKVH